MMKNTMGITEVTIIAFVVSSRITREQRHIIFAIPKPKIAY